LESITTVEKDCVEFIEFAIHKTESFRQDFWELDAEHLSWCKQLLFPESFSLSRDKKVYTPKISEFYCLKVIKKDSSKVDKSLMVTPAGL
jgi:hypothetical protein